ncbi:hypothetical protein CAQU_00280 [Corynebacterium aquilae DSM 44791]|uniref:Prealbumin-like fold domain-containing protein n=1 Tax=Corynebacterium aquilae DSM 44791 TaxID=1431546 RepID=A0A1L7CDA9_9CORY|nr:hypothetical protein CAQU_00280 [Corynebacterium aquilae DSM 44791]
MEKVGDNTWVYTVKANDVSGFEATFTGEAKVKEDAPGGSVISADTSFTFEPGTNKVGMTEITKQVVPTNGDVCTGYAKYTSKIPADSLGSWLADLKFAYNPAVATLDELPDNLSDLFAAASDPNARNSIKVTFPPAVANSPEGASWLESLKSGGVIDKNDTTKPLYGVDPKLDIPGMVFKDSINWKYDPKVWTGVDSWLGTGVTVEVHRGYNYANCKNNIATDGDVSRLNAFGVQYDMGRAQLKERVNASGAFILPGGDSQQGPWCTDIGYVYKANNKYGLFNTEKKASTDLVTPSPAPTWGTTLGMSSKFENRMYYLYGAMPGAPKLAYLDTKTLKVTELDWDASAFPTSKTLIGMTIDENGIAWMQRQADYSLYRADLNQAKPVVEKIGTIPSGLQTSFGTSVAQVSLLDISSLGGDKLLYSFKSSGKPSVVVSYEVSVAGNTMGAFNRVSEASIPNTVKIYSLNGLAFAKDGYAYVADQGQPQLKRFQLIKDGKYVAKSTLEDYVQKSAMVDLGSCYYPDVPPVEGGLKVQKSAVDPVTGELLAPGAAAVNKVKVAADGKAEVQYAIRVVNTGTKEAEVPEIQDTFTAPEGFVIKEMTARSESGVPVEGFTKETPVLNPGTLGAGTLKTYFVTVKLTAPSLEAIASAKGECDEMGQGASAGGFFNKVDMEGDKDGSKNNEACIPFEKPKTAKITLIKKIVDQNGAEITGSEPGLPEGFNLEAELAKFNLVATGFSDAGAPLSAVSGAAQANGVAVDNETVAAGNYSLAESMTAPNDGPGNGYYQAGAWDCGDKKLTLVADPGGDNVQRPRLVLPAGGSATCTIKNTFVIPQVHVEKFATNPALATVEGATAKHVGEPLILQKENGEGPAKGDLVYYVRVTNDTEKYVVSSGPVRDYFTMPAGLKIQDGKQVTVDFFNSVDPKGKELAPEQPGGLPTFEPTLEYSPANARLIVSGENGPLLRKIDISEFAYVDSEKPEVKGALLADNVVNLGSAKKPTAADKWVPNETSRYAYFRVTVPVQEVEGGKDDVDSFAHNSSSLGQCESTADGSVPGVQDGVQPKGAVNSASLTDGESDYTPGSGTKETDNNACIPVVKPAFHIEKLAANPTKNPHIGMPVNLDAKEADQRVLKYKVVVTNDTAVGENSDQKFETGQVTDTFKLPAGLKMQDDQNIKVEFEAASGIEAVGMKNSYTEAEFSSGAVLATKITGLAGAGKEGSTATFVITIPVDADESEGDAEPYFSNRENLGQCESESAGEGFIVKPGSEKGAINKVTLVEENPNYTDVPGLVENDNVACIPVEKKIPAKWEVNKTSATNAEGTEFTKPGDNPGAAVKMVEQDGKLVATATYKVTLTNTGKAEQELTSVTDTPTLPDGFKIDEITYQKLSDGEVVSVPNPANKQEFTIPGDREVKVPSQGTVEYKIVVKGSISTEDAAKLQWSASVGDTLNEKTKGVDECELTGNGTPGTGFFNLVSIEGDSDKTEDNDACVPLIPPATNIVIEKTDDSGSTRLTGAQFKIVKATGEPNAYKPGTEEVSLEALTAENKSRVPGADLTINDGQEEGFGRLVSGNLEVGKLYYIQETVSPGQDKKGAKYSLLPEPVLFKVVSAGTVVPVNELGEPLEACGDGDPKCPKGSYEVGKSFYFTAGKITVHDPRVGELPKAGGMGHWTLAGGAMLLIMLSLFAMYRTPGTRRKA